MFATARPKLRVLNCGLGAGLALLASTLFAGMSTASPEIVRSENWDGAWQANWQVEGGVWGVGRPLNSGIGEPVLPAGNQCAATALNAEYPNRAFARLIWSQTTLPVDNPRLRFEHWMKLSANDYGYVAIRLEGSAVWTQVSDFCTDSGAGTQSDCHDKYDTQNLWAPVSVDLSRFAGERAEIAFVFVSNSSNTNVGWYIDQVFLEAGDYDFVAEEGWEDGFHGWQAPMGLWEIGSPNPVGGPTDPHSGARCIGTLMAAEFPNSHTSRLSSPPFAVPSDQPRLSFWHWKETAAGDDGTVWIRARGTSAWIQIGSVTPNSTSGVWVPEVLDLSAFAGTEVEISFLFEPNSSNTNAGWFLDDVHIESGPYDFANLEQDWESGWNGWHAFEGLWERGAPHNGPRNAGERDNCVGTLLDSEYPNRTESRLVSPPFSVPEDRPRLRFLQWIKFGSSSAGDSDDTGTVWIRPKGQATWQSIGLNAYGPSTDGLWVPESIALDAFAGREVEISFLFHANSSSEGAGWFIDDIRVDSGAYSVAPVEGWESGYGDWTAPEGLWEVGNPIGGPRGPHSGDACIGTLLNDNYPNNESASLITPPMEIPSGDHAFLRFYHWMEVAPNDGGTLYYQTPGEGWRALRSYALTTSGWQREQIALGGDLQGQIVRFAYYFVSNGSSSRAGWFLDDIEVFQATPPAVVSVSPSTGTSVEEASIPLIVEFDRAVTGANNGTAWIVSGTISGTHTGAVETLSDTRYRFTSAREFVDGDVVTWELGTSVQSLEGLPLADRGPWTFTVALADTDPPTVVRLVPENGTTVTVDRPEIRVEFSEDVTGPDNAAAWQVAKNVNEAILGTVSGGPREFVFTPSSSIPAGTDVTVRIANSAVHDPAGNQLASDVAWHFAVEYDHDCPGIASRTPAPNSRDVDSRSIISVVFDEAVTGAQDPSAWVVTSSTSGQLSGTVTPNGCCGYDWHPSSGAFPEGEDISVQLSDTIHDAAGNALCASSAWTFHVQRARVPKNHQYVPAIPGGRYVMVTIPLAIDPDTRLSQVFSGQGPMSPQKWIGYGYVNGQLVQDPFVVEGRGYWIAFASETGIAPLISGYELPVDVAIQLDAGWNLVGVPEVRGDRFWADAEVVTPNGSLLLSDSAARAWVDDSIFWYEDDSANLVNDGGYMFATITGGATWAENAWGGYFVYAEQACELVLSNADDRALASRCAWDDPLASPEWRVTFRANGASGSDGGITIGEPRGDSRVTVRKPPMPLSSTSLQVVDSDGHSPLIASLLPANDEFQEWKLALAGPEEVVTLEWTDVESIPRGIYVYVMTPTGTIVDLRTTDRLTLGASGNAELRVVASKTPIPTASIAELELSVGPNPARGDVAIDFAIPRPELVELRVVDVTGRIVAEVARGEMDPGRRAVTWSPRSEGVSNGIYFVQLISGRTMRTQKLVLVR